MLFQFNKFLLCTQYIKCFVNKTKLNWISLQNNVLYGHVSATEFMLHHEGKNMICATKKNYILKIIMLTEKYLQLQHLVCCLDLATHQDPIKIIIIYWTFPIKGLFDSCPFFCYTQWCFLGKNNTSIYLLKQILKMAKFISDFKQGWSIFKS